MKRHYKNIKLIEEGFTEEYFEEKRKEAEARAKRWIEKTHEFNLKHLWFQDFVFYMLVVLTTLAIILPMIIEISKCF